MLIFTLQISQNVYITNSGTLLLHIHIGRITSPLVLLGALSLTCTPLLYVLQLWPNLCISKHLTEPHAPEYRFTHSRHGPLCVAHYLHTPAAKDRHITSIHKLRCLWVAEVLLLPLQGVSPQLKIIHASFISVFNLNLLFQMTLSDSLPTV